MIRTSIEASAAPPPVAAPASGASAAPLRRHVITALAYAVLAFICFRYGQEVHAGGNTFKTGDWLINYAGGPVRRGLIGQVLLEFSRIGLSLLWTTFALQCALYFLTAHYVLKLYFAVERGDAWLLLLFSPAFLFLFPAYNIEGGFRKEIILFLAYCLLCCGLPRGRFRGGYVGAALALYALAVFSHELTALCLPFMAYPLLQARRSGAPRAWVDASLAACGLLAAAGLALAVAFPGGEHGRQAVCDSLVGAGLDRGICAGSIEWLRRGTADGLAAVSADLGDYLHVYPMLLLFACIPFLLTDWPKRRLPLLAIGFAATLPLYVVAVDWGRWIHIYIFLVSVTLLYESAQAPVAIRKVPGAAVIAYLVLWDLPHCCAVWPGIWVVSMLHDLARGAFAF